MSCNALLLFICVQKQIKYLLLSFRKFNFLLLNTTFLFFFVGNVKIAYFHLLLEVVCGYCCCCLKINGIAVLCATFILINFFFFKICSLIWGVVAEYKNSLNSLYTSAP